MLYSFTHLITGMKTNSFTARPLSIVAKGRFFEKNGAIVLPGQ